MSASIARTGRHSATRWATSSDARVVLPLPPLPTKATFTLLVSEGVRKGDGNGRSGPPGQDDHDGAGHPHAGAVVPRCQLLDYRSELRTILEPPPHPSPVAEGVENGSHEMRTAVSMHIFAYDIMSGVHDDGPAADSAGALDATDVPAASDLLRALANPHRLAIVLCLRDDEQCVHELVAALGVPQPLISQHLRVLRSERLVTSRRRGREIAYSLYDDHVARIAVDAVTHAKERNTR
jgi:DNA-binding transcriptional ArsR family regulator